MTVAFVTACNPKIGPEISPRVNAGFRPVAAPEAALVHKAEWGVALSGGGLRAALFSVGALKALYDQGITDSVRIVSSVSGGGYTAYWLMQRERKRDVARERFGGRSLEKPSFQQGVCELATTGNFFTEGRGLRTLVNVFRPFNTDYELAIDRTFGGFGIGAPADSTRPWELHELAPDVRAGRLPYWIINTTVVDPDVREGYAERIFEFTPFLRGNERYGYHAWGDESIPIRKAVAVSGAAVAFALKQSVAEPLPRVILNDVEPFDPRELVLSDGGHSENFGAYALIHRHVPNIIIIDAGQDPTYSFGSYTELRDRLARWGYRVKIAAIDEYVNQRTTRPRLEKGVFRGTVEDTSGKSSYRGRLFFVKMSIPTSLDSTLQNERLLRHGAEVDSAMLFHALKDGPRDDRGLWNCANVRGLDLDLRALAVHEISIIPGGEDRRSRWLADLSRNFPQYTTFDQSFNLDRSFAFVGLGYLVAEELGPWLPRLKH